MKMTVGAEDRKKVVILIGLLVVAAAVFFINSGGEDPAAQAARTQSGPTPTTPLVAPRRAPTQQAQAPDIRRTPARGPRTLQEFRPSLKPKRPEDRPDPMTVDPELRLDMLAKLQNVSVGGTQRSLFDFSTAPPPKPSETAAAKKPVPSPFVEAAKPDEVKESAPPPPPPPPKIPLKFYGFTAAEGPKRAFFLEGDDIHVVREGEVVKKRYKIVRIGVNSVVVEDLEHNNQQTLPLEEAPAG